MCWIVRPLQRAFDDIDMTMAAVLGLFRFCGPSAIAREVSKVVINSVQRQFWWPFTQVGKEVCEIEPAFANSDASSTVGFIFQITSATEHSSPASISGCWRMASIMPVFQCVVQFLFDADAAASRGSGKQTVTANYFFNSTVTKTEKTCACFRHVRKPQDDQAAKPLTGEVFETSHAGGSHLRFC